MNNSFNDMPISNNIKMALEDMGFSAPTPIQKEVIPLILDGKDVIAQAPTGTGKTCAFGIPLINNIDTDSQQVQVLVLCPTRELAIQTDLELKDVSKHLEGATIVSIYGGQNIDRQLAALRKKPQVVVGTTGRIMDHIRRKSLKLGDIKVLVLDEVDEMLNMGFREDIDTILQSVPSNRQTVLFSATMPKEIVQISKLYQTEPISVKTLHRESDLPNINQHYVVAEEPDKVAALISLLQEKNYGLSLVFCNTKKRVDELNAILAQKGFSCDALHGDLRQHNRDKTMKKFRSGDTRILIATDVAARGIDVDNIEAVFNFDAPHDEEYYVHRIGRTARANKIGDAYTFVGQKQMYVIKNCEIYTKSTITKAEFSKETMNQTINKKSFNQTIKLAKKGGLDLFKDFLQEELNNADGPDLITLAAAMLFRLNEAQSTESATLSQPPKLNMKNKDLKGKSGVRFFMNIGTRDGGNTDTVSKFLTQKAGINDTDILDVYCLENYSFTTVTEGNVEAMESLNGLKFNKRIVAVEVAANEKKSFANAKTSTRNTSEQKSAKRSETRFDEADKPFGKMHTKNQRPFEGHSRAKKSFDKPFSNENQRPSKKSFDKEFGHFDKAQQREERQPRAKSFDRPFETSEQKSVKRSERPFESQARPNNKKSFDKPFGNDGQRGAKKSFGQAQRSFKKPFESGEGRPKKRPQRDFEVFEAPAKRPSDSFARFNDIRVDSLEKKSIRSFTKAGKPYAKTEKNRSGKSFNKSFSKGRPNNFAQKRPQNRG